MWRTRGARRSAHFDLVHSPRFERVVSNVVPSLAAFGRAGRNTRSPPSVPLIMPSLPQHEGPAKWLLALVTLLLMVSMGGGFLLLPLLIPAHGWAARRSGRVGAVGWCLLPAAALAMFAWAGVYTLSGESRPAIWLAPMLVLIAAHVGFVRAAALHSAHANR